eukprot:6325288-Amphidinium_carterae.1
MWLKRPYAWTLYSVISHDSPSLFACLLRYNHKKNEGIAKTGNDGEMDVVVTSSGTQEAKQLLNNAHKTVTSKDLKANKLSGRWWTRSGNQERSCNKGARQNASFPFWVQFEFALARTFSPE